MTVSMPGGSSPAYMPASDWPPGPAHPRRAQLLSDNPSDAGKAIDAFTGLPSILGVLDGANTFTPGAGTATFKIVSRVPVTMQTGSGSDIIAAQTPGFEADQLGNVWLGPNELAPRTLGAPGSSPPNPVLVDAGYHAQTRRFYTRQIVMAEVGNSANLAGRRFGPDNTYPLGPNGTFNGLTGIVGAAPITQWFAQPAVTGLDGKVSFQTLCSNIIQRTAESAVQTGANAWSTGGAITLQTTPNGSGTPLDRLELSQSGIVGICGAALSRSDIDDVHLGATRGDLVVNGSVITGSKLVAGRNVGGDTTAVVSIGDVGPASEAGVKMGPTANPGLLYRPSPNALRTPGALTVDGQVVISGAGTGLNVTNSASIGSTLSMAGSGATIAFTASTGAIVTGIRSGDAANRVILRDSQIEFGPGTGATDVIIRRSTTNRVGINESVTGGEVMLANATGKLGTFQVGPVARQTVTGSRAGNAALASVLTALAAYGIVIDSSTA